MQDYSELAGRRQLHAYRYSELNREHLHHYVAIYRDKKENGRLYLEIPFDNIAYIAFRNATDSCYKEQQHL